ncbi:MAG: phosphatase PAP2 family protein [Chlamydiales bacterium]|nr:phosphatase PAP2 family protein [Chlamydiales bacterium]
MKKHLKWIIPCILFILIAPFTPKLDLLISHFFYIDHFSKAPIWQLFYDYGTWPAWIVAVISLIIIIASFFSAYWKKFKKDALLFLCSLILGGGIITNLLLKQFWQRPRPVQLDEFGGFIYYHPFWIPLHEYTIEPGRSFPCGHCTMGFIFLAFCFIGIRRNNRPIFYTGLFITLFLGIGLSLSRIAMGGHFFSDTLASLLIMWLSIVTMDAFLYRKNSLCTD